MTTAGSNDADTKYEKTHIEEPLLKAEDFIERLESFYDPDNPDNRYLFRGLSDAKYKLIPSALRKKQSPLGYEGHDEIEQIRHEARALMHFFDAAHLEGLPIPSRNKVSELMERVRKNYPINEADWPPEEIQEFVALAQHYGVPTRLLDWTIDPMVAAYFAACPPPCTADRKQTDDQADGTLAVWIFDLFNLRKFLGQNWVINGLLNIIHIPFDLNVNARAQRGCFSITRKQHTPSPHPTILPTQPLELQIGRFRSVCAPTTDLDGMHKITLPRSEAGNVMNILERRRITAAMLFPGYSGAAIMAMQKLRRT